MPSDNDTPGLLAAFKGLLANGISLLETRLALLGAELREEKLRLLALLLWSLAALILLLVGVVFVAVFLTVLFWDSHRLLMLGIFAALFLGSGFIALANLRRLLTQGSVLFRDSLAELAADRAVLGGRKSGDQADG